MQFDQCVLLSLITGEYGVRALSNGMPMFAHAPIAMHVMNRMG